MRSILNTIKRWWVRRFRPVQTPAETFTPVHYPPEQKYEPLYGSKHMDHRREHGRGKR